MKTSRYDWEMSLEDFFTSIRWVFVMPGSVLAFCLVNVATYLISRAMPDIPESTNLLNDAFAPMAFILCGTFIAPYFRTAVSMALSFLLLAALLLSAVLVGFKIVTNPVVISQCGIMNFTMAFLYCIVGCMFTNDHIK